MTTIDWIALALVGLAALNGFRRGLIGSALSLAGIVVGAIVGSRVAPHLLGASVSRWTPFVALGGALVGAAVLSTVGAMVGRLLRSGLRLTPLRTLDSLIGLLVGAVTGFALVWVLGAAALQIPGRQDVRRQVQRSEILRRLNELVPPDTLLSALSRIDLLPKLLGPDAPVAPPTGAVLRLPGVRAAALSVVRVTGTACGLGITGSGWVAGRERVVTAAHVVAGQRSTRVQVSGRRSSLRARTVAFDARNDVAVLRVPGLRVAPLRLAEAHAGDDVAILGYPEAGPLAATAGRVGATGNVRSTDLYGRGPISRAMTSVRGRVRHGNSGGPAVDARGAVQATIFGAATGGAHQGLGVPTDVVRAALDRARGAVSTGRCIS